MTVTDWQIDEQGRRYRMIGKNCKEYEMIYEINGFSVPESQLAEFTANKKENKPDEVIQPQPMKSCPVRKGLNTDCIRDCALYSDAGCRLVTKTIRQETTGKSCPFSGRKCNENCMLHSDSGCMI